MKIITSNMHLNRNRVRNRMWQRGIEKMVVEIDTDLILWEKFQLFREDWNILLPFAIFPFVRRFPISRDPICRTQFSGLKKSHRSVPECLGTKCRQISEVCQMSFRIPEKEVRVNKISWPEPPIPIGMVNICLGCLKMAL